MCSTSLRHDMLDLVDRLAIESEQASRLESDLKARDVLWAGLEFLYSLTRELETHVAPETQEGQYCTVWGNIPNVRPQTLRELSCFFDWYSVSACNVVVLTGWIAKNCGVTTEGERDYMRRVIPDVVTHRHKIGAHAARVWPKDDGPATQEASQFRQLAIVDGRFIANRMALMLRRDGQASDSRILRPWGLTETHERLRSRYVQLT